MLEKLDHSEEKRPNDRGKTALVFADGGSLGAVQVGMLNALISHGVQADFLVGASVGAINAAYFAGQPTGGCPEGLCPQVRRG